MELTVNQELSYALNTFYLLISAVLVMWMGTGFTMLEAGLVRSKNTIAIIIKNLTLYAIACLMYLLIGYDMMFNSPENGLIPSFSQIFDFSLTTKDSYVILNSTGDLGNHAQSADFFFQVVFVAIAMSIISGAIAERMKLWPFVLFAIVMTGLIYPVEAYWNWGDGFLAGLGYRDFAGSGTVHLAGATAALAGVILLGPRQGKYGTNGQINALPGANLPLATLGTLILWLGWLGFNGGSQSIISTVEDANTVAMIFVNTTMAGAGGLLATTLICYLLFSKADLTMILNGMLAGLVAITAGPDTPSPLAATLIGTVGGVLGLFATLTLEKFKIDDPVGAISVHGAVGIWGVLAVPLTDPETAFINQFIGIAVIFSWVFTVSFSVWYILKMTVGLRITEEEEYDGLDITECGMEAYPEFVGPKKP